MDFCSGKSQRHASSTVNADFASKDLARFCVSISGVRRFKGRILKSASLRKPKAAFPQQNEDRVFNNPRSRLEVCVLPRIEGCVASNKSNNSEPRLSITQSRIFPAIQGYILPTNLVLLEFLLYNCKRRFKGRVLKSASLHRPKAVFPQQNEDRILNNSGPHFEVRVLPRAEGCVTSNKLKSLGPRLSSIQGHVLPSILDCFPSSI